MPPSKFVTQASRQLSPAYATQTKALTSQIPAIQQLFQILMQSLEGQQQVGNQNIFEDASGRGLLRSTIPVDAQTGLAQQIMQQRNQYQAQQGQQIGDIRSQVAGIGVDRSNAISNLANTLYGQNLQQRQATQQSQFQNQQLALQKQLANRQYSLDQKALSGGYY